MSKGLYRYPKAVKRPGRDHVKPGTSSLTECYCCTGTQPHETYPSLNPPVFCRVLTLHRTIPKANLYRLVGRDGSWVADPGWHLNPPKSNEDAFDGSALFGHLPGTPSEVESHW